MGELGSDVAFIAKALGDIARAKGMAQVACGADLSRKSLYKTLFGDRSPDVDTILMVIGALGLTSYAQSAGGRIGKVASRSSGRQTKRRGA